MDYQTGFLNHFATEAVEGALPVGRNSPQKPAFGLYAEQFSTTAFTAPRVENRRSWLYRMRPTAAHGKLRKAEEIGTRWLSSPLDCGIADPNRMRWDPLSACEGEVDFIAGMTTYCANGDVATCDGLGVHLYTCNASMESRALQVSDGEMLIVPQHGTLHLTTEFGKLDVPPGHIALIPRGVRFSVAVDGPSAGYVCENYGEPFRLPDLGPIGANGLASPRDFEAPVAAFEDRETDFTVIQKYQGHFWCVTLDHSPFDVVAWHGNTAPYRYDLARFNTIGTISFDHPDPSIFTVLTSPGAHHGTANCDFAIFPPRWLVAEDTFRPPWFHRNVMSEFMGLVHGEYDAKEGDGFAPGGASLHNQMNGHGPDAQSAQKAMEADLRPHKIDDTLAFMFESRWPYRLARQACELPGRQTNYDDCWADFPTAELP